MRRLLLVLLLALAGAVVYALWPLADPALAIHPDPEATRAAQAFLAAPPARPEGTPPNVVLIVADDLGKHDTSVYQPASTPTPNLERFASGGVVFDAGYVTSPVCAPSRAALLTGRYEQRFGFELLTHDRYPRNRLEVFFARHFLASRGWEAAADTRVPPPADVDRQGVPTSELLLSELLKKQGYATGIFGKWHLGNGPELVPERRGFDTQYGFYEAFSLYADPADSNFVGVHDDYYADNYQWSHGRSGNSAIRRDGVVIDESRYLTDAIADEAIAFVDAHKDGPFFAYVPFNAPHAPMQAPRDWVERFGSEPRPERRVYLAMIAKLDAAIGRILDAIDRDGLADRTLVIFVSDNGAATYTGIASNAPLTGGKFTNFEGGINVPFVLRWPGKAPAGTRYAEPVSTLDAFATIARAASVTLPADHRYDGVDLIPYVRGDAGGPPHSALYWRTGGHRGIRLGSQMLISDTRTGTRVLFDLAQDPAEHHDLSAQQPEQVESLEQRLRAWEAQLEPPHWPPVMEYHFRIDGRDFVFPL